MIPSTVDAIIDVLKRLPIRDDLSGDPDLFLLRRAKELRGDATMAWLNDQPVTRPAGALLHTEIEQFEKTMATLCKQISEMHSEPHGALAREAGAGKFHQFKTDAFFIANAAQRAAAILSAKSPHKHKGGRRRADVADAVTISARRVYELITGRSAGHTTDPDTGKTEGPFVDFLDELFYIFEIKKYVAVSREKNVPRSRRVKAKNSAEN